MIKLTRWACLHVALLAGSLAGCQRQPAPGPAGAGRPSQTQEAPDMSDKVVKTDEEWRRLLTPEQYRIMRQKGTERAFTGEYWNTKTKGVYRCAGCGQELFESDTKFGSGCGWPSFWAPAGEKTVRTESDTSLGMVRTEILCSRCDAHLGHVFEDGPKPTGLRYCVNSAALKLVKEE